MVCVCIYLCDREFCCEVLFESKSRINFEILSMTDIIQSSLTFFNFCWSDIINQDGISIDKGILELFFDFFSDVYIVVF